MTESSVLSVRGGILAVPLSYLMLVRGGGETEPGDIPRFEETTLDMRVLLFGLSASIVTGLVSGILPALAASRISVGNILRQGGRGIAGVSWRARDVLIVSEIAITVVLLAGAGLLIRSYLFVKERIRAFPNRSLPERCAGPPSGKCRPPSRGIDEAYPGCIWRSGCRICR
jgi:putative ABC transport system permease protein